MRALAACLCCSAALSAISGRAAADTRQDIERLARTWTERGSEVVRLPPMFVEHGRAAPLAVPASSGAAPCAAIVVLGVRGADFALRPFDPDARAEDREEPPGPAPERRGQSAHGLAVLSRCGATRTEIDHALVEMRASRGAVEVLLVRSAAPRDMAQDATEILPERAIGPLAQRGDTGRPIEPGPLADRLVRAERRARQDGAGEVGVARLKASAQGVGLFSMRLGEGCHRIEVMAEIPTKLPRPVTDVDVEAREAVSGRVLARDRGEAPDARVDVCVGETTVVEVAFAGAAGAVEVAASTARWAIPAMAPSRWGPRGRAAFAAALLRRGAPTIAATSPAYESLGVSGSTVLGLRVEPGVCYVAALAVVRGEARGIRLSAAIGDRAHRDEGIDRTDGAAVAFCAHSESARLDVEVRGASPWWALGVWAMP